MANYSLNADQKPDPSPDVTAKLDRARFLLLEIAAISQEYLMSVSPVAPVVKADRDASAYILTVNFPQPPLALALLFGDFLNNLRSSLDYVLRALVIDSGGKPIDGGPGSTQFPIRNHTEKRIPADFLGLNKQVVEIIDKVQPYQLDFDAAAEHPLAQLSLFNRIDKHRLLNVTALSGSGDVVFIHADIENVELTQEHRRYRVELLPGISQTIRVESDEIFDLAKTAGMWSYGVVLGEPGAQWSMELGRIARKLLTFVDEDVVGKLRKFL